MRNDLPYECVGHDHEVVLRVKKSGVCIWNSRAEDLPRRWCCTLMLDGVVPAEDQKSTYHGVTWKGGNAEVCMHSSAGAFCVGVRHWCRV